MSAKLLQSSAHSDVDSAINTGPSPDPQEPRERRLGLVFTTFSWVSLSIGTLCLAVSPYLPRQGMAFSMVLALGTALMPAGLVAIITAWASSQAIEMKLGRKIDDQSRALTNAVERLNSTTTYLEESHRLGVKDGVLG